jgi:hypothetical protein
MRSKIYILSAVLVLVNCGGVLLSNMSSKLNIEKSNYLITVNQTLLDSHDKGFSAIGCELDAIGFLIEHRTDAYNKSINEATRTKESFDELYYKAQSDLSKVTPMDKKIARVGFWNSLVPYISMTIAVFIVLLKSRSK